MSPYVMVRYKFVLDRKRASKQIFIQWTRCMMMNMMYKDEKTDKILLADASNAFN